MKNRTIKFTSSVLIATTFLIISISVQAHPHVLLHTHNMSALDGLMFLLGFMGVAAGFYCLYRSHKIQSRQKTLQEQV